MGGVYPSSPAPSALSKKWCTVPNPRLGRNAITTTDFLQPPLVWNFLHFPRIWEPGRGGFCYFSMDYIPGFFENM